MYGGVSRVTTEQSIIKNGETSLPYTYETVRGRGFIVAQEMVEVNLTYYCGQNKIVSFKSKKTVDKGLLSHTSTVEGYPFSLFNMDAEYTEKKATCLNKNPKPTTMIWTLR